MVRETLVVSLLLGVSLPAQSPAVRGANEALDLALKLRQLELIETTTRAISKMESAPTARTSIPAMDLAIAQLHQSHPDAQQYIPEMVRILHYFGDPPPSFPVREYLEMVYLAAKFSPFSQSPLRISPTAEEPRRQSRPGVLIVGKMPAEFKPSVILALSDELTRLGLPVAHAEYAPVSDRPLSVNLQMLQNLGAAALAYVVVDLPKKAATVTFFDPSGRSLAEIETQARWAYPESDLIDKLTRGLVKKLPEHQARLADLMVQP